MKKLIIILVLSTLALYAIGQEDFWITRYEKSGFLETANYEEVIRYSKLLDQKSSIVKYKSYGISPQGRDMPLLIIDRNGNFDPESVKASGNVVLFIQAGIHPGEADGTDAVLMLMRDMAITRDLYSLLEKVTFLVIPSFNVDGLGRFGPYNRINQNGPEEMGWRSNAQNLNLNRDYLKADTPEMHAWLKLFNEWLPDFFVDCHTTDGADFQYVLTYMMEIFGNMDPGLTAWQRDIFLPYVHEKMEIAGYPINQYVSFRRWHDPRSGLVSGTSSPRLSNGF
ncbi:MAG: M14 family zinc carboxypeptidase, partial [Bacteroidota bacterium]|nr:M14 family zinc carboxypeptidase [Bacteroidota bacterium]